MLRPDRTTQPEIFRPGGIKIPQVGSEVFANGMKCHVLRTTDEPVCRVDWVFSAGTGDCENPLVPVFTAYMLKEGCKNLSSARIAEILDSKGATFAVRPFVTHTVLTLLCLRKHVEELLPLVQQLVFAPTFPSDKLSLLVEREKYEFVLEQKKVQNVASQLLREALYGKNHPYSLHKEQAYYKVSSSDLRKFHSKHYRSSNCSVVLSGNTDRELYLLTEKFFGKAAWNYGGSIVKALWPSFLSSSNYKIKLQFDDSLQSGIAIGAPTSAMGENGHYAVNTLITALGGYFGSRLNKSVREEKGYTYGIGASVSSFADKSHFSVRTRTRCDVVNEVIDTVRHEISNLAEHKMPPDELETVRNLIVSQINRTFEHPLYLADSFISLLSKGTDFAYYRDFYDFLDMATPESLRSDAEKYLRQPLYEVVAGR